MQIKFQPHVEKQPPQQAWQQASLNFWSVVSRLMNDILRLQHREQPQLLGHLLERLVGRTHVMAQHWQAGHRRNFSLLGLQYALGMLLQLGKGTQAVVLPELQHIFREQLKMRHAHLKYEANYRPGAEAQISQRREVKPISSRQLWRVVHGMHPKKDGLDSWSLQNYQQLPWEAFSSISWVIGSVEADFEWPSTAKLVSIALLPKSDQEERPIALTACVYRIWLKTWGLVHAQRLKDNLRRKLGTLQFHQ